jgi:hypothetical protein
MAGRPIHSAYYLHQRLPQFHSGSHPFLILSSSAPRSFRAAGPRSFHNTAGTTESPSRTPPPLPPSPSRDLAEPRSFPHQTLAFLPPLPPLQWRTKTLVQATGARPHRSTLPRRRATGRGTWRRRRRARGP